MMLHYVPDSLRRSVGNSTNIYRVQLAHRAEGTAKALPLSSRRSLGGFVALLIRVAVSLTPTDIRNIQ